MRNTRLAVAALLAAFAWAATVLPGVSAQEPYIELVDENKWATSVYKVRDEEPV